MKRDYEIPWELMGMMADLEGVQCGIVFKNVYRYIHGDKLADMSPEGQEVFYRVKEVIDAQRS